MEDPPKNQDSKKNEYEKKEQGLFPRLFDEWARIIGTVFLVILTYLHVNKGVEINTAAWAAAGVLTAGDKIKQLIKK